MATLRIVYFFIFCYLLLVTICKLRDKSFHHVPRTLLRKKNSEEDKINDDLFYDPNMDDEDQKWADNFRRQYVPKGFPGTKEKPLPNSDAVLNCPACFILLCLDCQRHSQYEHQYRAMFVMNCEVDYSQHLKYPKAKNKRKRGKKNKNEPMVDENDMFNPVKCNRCSTQVAVYDKDEVYHFFNVTYHFMFM